MFGYYSCTNALCKHEIKVEMHTTENTAQRRIFVLGSTAAQRHYFIVTSFAFQFLPYFLLLFSGVLFSGLVSDPRREGGRGRKKARAKAAKDHARKRLHTEKL